MRRAMFPGTNPSPCETHDGTVDPSPGRLAKKLEGLLTPYNSIDDLPLPISEHLPGHARKVYRAAFNNAWDEYVARGVKREEIAHRVAWAAVKRRYRKEGSEWVPL
jgi:cation transport regulator